HSDRPSRSGFVDPDIEALQQNLPPASAFDLFRSANSVQDWIRPFLWLFVCFSAIGLVVSLWVHLGAVMGRRVAPEALFWMLGVGIFIVWLPAVLVAQLLLAGYYRPH